MPPSLICEGEKQENFTSVFIGILNAGYRPDATTVHFSVVGIYIGTFNDRYRLDARLVHYSVWYIGVLNDGYRLVTITVHLNVLVTLISPKT